MDAAGGGWVNALMKSTIGEIVSRIVATVDPERIVLFGSQTDDAAGPGSDVDLLVIESEPFSRSRSRLAEIGRIECSLGTLPVATDILVYSRDEVERLQHAANHVVARALDNGEVVYARY